MFGGFKINLYICSINKNSMLIRLETIYKSKQVILVDEIGKYVGTLENIEQFLECVDLDKEPLEEDGYVFYFVEDNCIFNFLGGK